MQNSWMRGALGALLIGALHVAAVSAAPTTSLAQEPGTRPQGPPPGRGPGGNPEERADELAKSLKLSDKQKGEVATIFKNQHQQMEALRGSATADREKGMTQMRRLDSDTDAKLKAVLSADQYNKYLAQKPKRGDGPKDGKAGKGGKGGKPVKGANANPAREQAN